MCFLVLHISFELDTRLTETFANFLTNSLGDVEERTQTGLVGLDIVGATPKESPQASEAHETLNRSNLFQVCGISSYVTLCEDDAAVAAGRVRVVEFALLGH